MDRKSIIVLVFCFLVLMAWQPLVNKFYPPVPITNAVPAQVTFTNGTAAVLSTQTSAVLPEAASTPMVASVLSPLIPDFEKPVQKTPPSGIGENLQSLSSLVPPIVFCQLMVCADALHTVARILKASRIFFPEISEIIGR